jgi:hypothetical protein
MTSKKENPKPDQSTRRKAGQTRRARQVKQNPAPPPVMARGYNMEAPLHVNQAYTKKNRRRVDVPLGVPGAEMRLPALPAIRAGARWLSFLLVLGLLVGLYFLWNAPYFRVGPAVVQGVKRVSSNDVNAVMQVSGKPVFTLHPAKLQAALEKAFPEFSAVSVDVSLPNSIVVQVTERVPVLTWRSNGQSQLIDSAGYIFPMRLEASQLISPVVEASGNPPSIGVTAESIAAMIAVDGDQQSDGKDNQDQSTKANEGQDVPVQPFIKPEMVAAVLAISKSVPANVTLLYDPAHGFGWQDELGWKVYLGDDQDTAMKLQVYAAIVQRLQEEDIQPTLISVEYVHNPYYRTDQ